MSQEARNRKIADAIQRELSELIRLEMRDPRVTMVTLPPSAHDGSGSPGMSRAMANSGASARNRSAIRQRAASR